MDITAVPLTIQVKQHFYSRSVTTGMHVKCYPLEMITYADDKVNKSEVSAPKSSTPSAVPLFPSRIGTSPLLMVQIDLLSF